MRLALDAGRPVSADRLLDDLWAGAPTQRNTLQSKVARLRRALQDPAVIDGTLPARRATRAGRRAARAERRRGRRAPPRSRRRARRPRAQRWPRSTASGGELLPAAGDWAAPHRSQLDEARARLLETQLRGAAAARRAGRSRARGRACATAPYQEGLWELLITALYRAGRQADALAAYQRVRTRLADDLGLDPGRACRSSSARCCEHDPALRAAPAGNLPSLQPELVGRDADVAALTRLLRTAAAGRARRPRRHRQDGRRRS